RYQRDGTGASSAKPASPNRGRSAGSNCATSSPARSSASPTPSSRTPLMSGWTLHGSARSQVDPAASPASSWRVSAATGQWFGTRRRCGSSCARRPASRPCATSERPSAIATGADGACVPNRRAAGSSSVAEARVKAGSGAVAHADDLELPRAGGGLDGDAVALVLADQRTRDRRGNRDQAQLDVGLEVADDLVAPLLVGFHV